MEGALDPPTIRRAMEIYAGSLLEHRDEIDSLNVYPVADGDTGTNLLLTQEAVVAALAGLEGVGATLGRVGACVSRAALMAARGNSGVILSQVLRGMFDTWGDRKAVGPHELAEGLEHASREAYAAVARPEEGTILSVMREASRAARVAADRGDVGITPVMAAALQGARQGLERTTDALPELRRAGVVDAGGKGMVLLLDAMYAAVTGGDTSEPTGPLGPVGRVASEQPVGPPEFAYEVQYLLEPTGEVLEPIRRSLAEVGDSLVIVGGGGLYHVHVHTDDPDLAVLLGSRGGVVRDVRIALLEVRGALCPGDQARAVRVAQQVCGLVAVAEGEGLARAFSSLGAIVVTGGPGNGPTVLDLVAAIEAAPARAVAVLPNHPTIAPVAEQAAAASWKDVRVVPSTSIPSGIAAATAFNPLSGPGDNAQAMEDAALACRSGRLAVAERDSDTPAGPVRRGDWIGLADGDVVVVGRSAAMCAVAVVGELALGAGLELLTLVAGRDAGVDLEVVRVALEEAFPHLQMQIVDGGQPRYPFLIGVE